EDVDLSRAACELGGRAHVGRSIHPWTGVEAERCPGGRINPPGHVDPLRAVAEILPPGDRQRDPRERRLTLHLEGASSQLDREIAGGERCAPVCARYGDVMQAGRDDERELRGVESTAWR